MPVVQQQKLPVRYTTWAEWRSEHSESDIVAADRLAPTTTSFCVTCAGNGRTYEYAKNGEGLIPVPCVSCLGLGTS